MTEEDNRLMDPLSIADILKGESEQVSPDFLLEPYQVPFFERFREYFFALIDEIRINRSSLFIGYGIWTIHWQIQ